MTLKLGRGGAVRHQVRMKARSVLNWLAFTWLLPGFLTLVAYVRLAANGSSSCGGEPTCEVAQTWMLFALWFWGLAAFFIAGLLGALVIAARQPSPS